MSGKTKHHCALNSCTTLVFLFKCLCFTFLFLFLNKHVFQYNSLSFTISTSAIIFKLFLSFPVNTSGFFFSFSSNPSSLFLPLLPFYSLPIHFISFTALISIFPSVILDFFFFLSYLFLAFISLLSSSQDPVTWRGE